MDSRSSVFCWNVTDKFAVQKPTYVMIGYIRLCFYGQMTMNA